MGKRKRRDPFADYVEWSNNRYNPGHYLGGNIPPYLRKSSLGPRASRRMATGLAVSAALALGIFLITLAWSEPDFGLSMMLSAGWVVLVSCAAVAMFRNSRRKHHSPSD
jgi:hypothetical protein